MSNRRFSKINNTIVSSNTVAEARDLELNLYTWDASASPSSINTTNLIESKKERAFLDTDSGVNVIYSLGVDTEENAINLCNILGLKNPNECVLLRLYPFSGVNNVAQIRNDSGTTNYVYMRNANSGAIIAQITIAQTGIQATYPVGGQTIFNVQRTTNVSNETVIIFNLIQITGWNS